MLLSYPDTLPVHKGPKALLPKLRLNRHTPRAILFGSPYYGGIDLPYLFLDQGIGQLKWLFGHIKSGDDVGSFLLILLSHVQLHLGVSQPFLTLPFPKYAKWVNKVWLTSV